MVESDLGSSLMTDAAQILILGPIQVRMANGDVFLGGARFRAFLGALTVSANHSVRVDTLADLVWGDEAPADLATSVHSMATRLRGLLGTDMVVGEDHSYRLVADCEQIDACRFERSVVAAEEALVVSPAESRRLVREGLGLWRGPAFGDLADVDPFRLEAIRLDELRLSAIEIGLTADLALGHTTQAVPLLETMVLEHPYRERLWELLITALWRAERRVDALHAFDRYSAEMARAGLDAAPRLRALRDHLLNDASIDSALVPDEQRRPV